MVKTKTDKESGEMSMELYGTPDTLIAEFGLTIRAFTKEVLDKAVKDDSRTEFCAHLASLYVKEMKLALTELKTETGE